MPALVPPRSPLPLIHLASWFSGLPAAEKVKEILRSGRSQRLDAMAHNEQRQTLDLFMDVWGAALGTAERWYYVRWLSVHRLESRREGA